MPLTRETAPNRALAEQRACELAAAWRAQGARPVLLLPTRAAVRRVRAVQAAEACSFGVEVATPEDWAADRWELAGDGRRLVSSDVRSLLVKRVLTGAGRGVDEPAVEGALAATPGTADVVARLARDFLPVFERMPQGDLAAAGLVPAELEVCAAVRCYSRLLRGRGFIEPSQVMELLPNLPLPVGPVVLVAFDQLPAAVARLAQRMADDAAAEVVVVDNACSQPTEVDGRAPELDDLLRTLRGADAQAAASEPVGPTGAVRFLLPSGPLAAPRLVAEAAARAAGEETVAAQAQDREPLPVVVAARDPKALFEDVAPALAAQGVSVAAASRVPFGQTPFGRSFLSLARLVRSDAWEVAQASDVALGPLSGIPLAHAHKLDAQWRGNRLVTREGMLHDLGRVSRVVKRAAAALAKDAVDAALAAFEDAVRCAPSEDAAERGFLLASAAVAQRMVACAVELGVSADETLELLEGLPVSWSSFAPAAPVPTPGRAAAGRRTGAPVPAVQLMTLAAAAELGASSAAAVIVCDLTSAAYPVRTPEDAAATIAAKLGLGAPPDALDAARRQLFCALDAVRTQVVLERPLNVADAQQAYAAVVLEELVDCYRADATTDADLDRATGLPRQLLPFAQTAGEDALLQNLSLGAEGAGQSWTLPKTGQVSRENRPLVVLPRPRKRTEGATPGNASKAASGAASAKARAAERNPFAALPEGLPEPLCLSASAIESYLECPYKWFAHRRLRAQSPDAGFGPVEMGSFAHGVLKSFYAHFQEDLGLTKVTRQNLPQARELLSGTFQRHLDFQGELRPSENPLVPRTPLEEAQARDLERCLDAYLGRECELLPGFAPTHFEFSFGDGEGVPYAGALLTGSVDRIDVDAHGNAVIIDYKGKLTDEYDLAACSPVPWSPEAGLLPHKVQALIYAQVVQRVLGYRVVGAVYVSYGRSPRIHGAFDRTVIGEELLPGIRPKRCGVPGVELDAAEATAGEAGAAGVGEGAQGDAAAEAPLTLGAGSFAHLIDQVESGITCALGQLAAGNVQPCPRGGAPCAWCPVSSCERRGV